jgi:hypothetical protein
MDYHCRFVVLTGNDRNGDHCQLKSDRHGNHCRLKSQSDSNSPPITAGSWLELAVMIAILHKKIITFSYEIELR